MNISHVLKRFTKADRQLARVAVVCGRRGVHVAQVQFLAGRPRVMRCTFHPYAEVGAKALEEVRKQSALEQALCVTLMAPDDYTLMLVDAPNVPAEELKTAARWKIKDMVPYHVDDASVDILKIPTSQYGGERLKSIYVVSASHTAVRKQADLFDQAKLALDVIDIPELAQRNVARMFEDEGRALMMLSFDDEGGLLTITSGGELYMARRTDITLGQLQDADEGMRRQYCDRVELEVQRSLDYFDRQFQHAPVSRMLVCLPTQNEMDKLLTNNLGLPVEQLDLSQQMDISAVPELLDSEFACHALFAIGAALRQEEEAA